MAKQHVFPGWEPRSVYDLIGDIVLRANPPRPLRIVFPGKPPPVQPTSSRLCSKWFALARDFGFRWAGLVCL